MLKNPTGNGAALAFHPANVSRLKKQRYLLAMSEDEFRDKVVRPVFQHLGFKDGRELCGPLEEGKDTVFVDTDPLGHRLLYVVQTKKGNLNLSSKATENTVTAATQLKTAIATRISFLHEGTTATPDFAYLCASGMINERARQYIRDEIRDNRIRFADAGDFIGWIDEHMPEFWWDVDANRFPYLRALRDRLLRSSDTITLSEMGIGTKTGAPITDEMFVQLYLHRLYMKVKKERGRFVEKPDVEQLPIQAVLSRREALILVIGDAGSGKTTALRRLAYSTAQRSLEMAARPATFR